MFFCYIIYSETYDKYYIGSTENIGERLKQHNSGISTFTSRASDWKLVYSEYFYSRAKAVAREREIKKKKSRNFIEWLIAKGIK